MKEDLNIDLVDKLARSILVKVKQSDCNKQEGIESLMLALRIYSSVYDPVNDPEIVEKYRRYIVEHRKELIEDGS